jgi:hypothetical protein
MSSKHQDVYCRELADLLARCDSDDPDPDLLAQIERHMEACEVCEHAETALSQQIALFRDATTTDVSDEFECNLVDQLCRKPAG